MGYSFDPRILRQQLPDWSFGWGAKQLSPQAQAYLAYYGLPFEMAARIRFGALECAGYRIACLQFEPAESRGTLALVHGYFDHLALYRHLIQHYLARGWRVLTFDLPGHGLSTGVRGSIEDFVHYQEVLGAVLGELGGDPRQLWLLGQSTGGAIVADYLLRNDPEHLGGAILLAPLVRPARWDQVRGLHRCLGWLPGLPRRFNQNSNDQEFVRFIRDQDPLAGRLIRSAWVGALKSWVEQFEARSSVSVAPLIVQGEADETLDWAHNLQVLEEKFPNARLLKLPGARHQLANEAPGVRQHYLDWLGAEGAP